MSTVKELPDGRFDVQDASGKSLLNGMGGPFRVKNTAEAAQRMLASFDTVQSQIENINRELNDVSTRNR